MYSAIAYSYYYRTKDGDPRFYSKPKEKVLKKGFDTFLDGWRWLWNQAKSLLADGFTHWEVREDQGGSKDGETNKSQNTDS